MDRGHLVDRGRPDPVHRRPARRGSGMFTGTFAGEAAYYHPGDNPGYRSFAGWFPDLAASLVVLANDDSVSMTDLLTQLLPAALDP